MAVAYPIAAGQRLTPAVVDHMYAIADTAVTTVTGTSDANISTVYVIPANDAAANMAYRLSCGGDGQWGTAPPTLTLAAGFAGANVGFSVVFNSGVLSSGALFRWSMRVMLIPVTTGGSATLHTSVEGCITNSANPLLPATAANNTIPVGGHSLAATAGDTTIANNFALRGHWSSTTGAPFITCRSTVFERLG